LLLCLHQMMGQMEAPAEGAGANQCGWSRFEHFWKYSIQVKYSKKIGCHRETHWPGFGHIRPWAPFHDCIN
jgi:hypothetical protein